MQAKGTTGQRSPPGKALPGAGDVRKIVAMLQNPVMLQGLHLHAQDRIQAALTTADHRVGILRAAQLEREGGILDPDAAFYLIGWAVEQLAADTAKALAGQWALRFDDIQAGLLREYGEPDMAELLLAAPDAYRHRVMKGHEEYRRTMKTADAEGAGDQGV